MHESRADIPLSPKQGFFPKTALARRTVLQAFRLAEDSVGGVSAIPIEARTSQSSISSAGTRENSAVL
jgi:hypothetical protein